MEPKQVTISKPSLLLILFELDDLLHVHCFGGTVAVWLVTLRRRRLVHGLGILLGMSPATEMSLAIRPCE